VDGLCVVYWMQRAQRGVDNPALDVAIEAANELDVPVVVFFGLHPHYPNSNLRHYSFLVDGLAETERRIKQRGCAFVLRPHPDHDLIRFCAEFKPALVVGDENPMRQPERWRASASAKLSVPFWTVDADVVVPASLFPREEYAARTLRPKLMRLLPVFLHPLPNPTAKRRWPRKRALAGSVVDTQAILERLECDRSVGAVRSIKGGTAAGLKQLELFINQRVASYDTERNLPDRRCTSELSAYLHFGHLGPLTIAIAVEAADAPKASKDAFLEELIVRRELAINFVARNPNYDSLEGCPDWGRKTLAAHALDPRPDTYSESQLEHSETTDSLWNAAQSEMVKSGRMHGYMRMYWAKKILEWTRSPEEAFEIAVRLNDRYEIDGRDPNGYTGISWAIGGRHDRPWAPARPVFGNIRYMSAAGCARKFDVGSYIARVNEM
jgi:deoxyribodipyrimidine photo-lyase